MKSLFETASPIYGRRGVAAAAMALPLMLTGCGTAQESHGTSSPSAIDTAPSNPGSGASSPSEKAEQRQSKYQITFDFFNAGSEVIEVYAGPGPDGTEATGTFLDGQSAPAYCKTNGREISSAPGETPARTSDQWIKIMTNNSDNTTKYFATAVYIENPETVLSKLPEC